MWERREGWWELTSMGAMAVFEVFEGNYLKKFEIGKDFISLEGG